MRLLVVTLLFWSVHSFAQDISGKWETYDASAIYGALELQLSPSGHVTGYSQGSAIAGLSLEGQFNTDTKRLNLSNKNRGSNLISKYELVYKKNEYYEFLSGTIRVFEKWSGRSRGSCGSRRPQARTRNVSYFRPIRVSNTGTNAPKESAVARKDPKPKSIPEPISREERKKVYENTPLPIPEPVKKETAEAVVSENESKNPIPEPKKAAESYDDATLKSFKDARTDEIVASYSVGNKRKIKLKFRDYGEEDNDIISVFLDDIVVIKNHVISRDGKEFEISFAPGVAHKLTFVANNLGEVAPNTCTVSFVFGNKSYYKRLFTDETKNAVIVLKP